MKPCFASSNALSVHLSSMESYRSKFVAILSLLLSVGGFLNAAEPVAEPLKVSASDVLKFLGAHAWKWTYRAPASYKEITVRLVHFTRAASGEFEREELSGNSAQFVEAHTAEDILIVCGSKDGHATFVLSFGHGTIGPEEHAGIVMTDYSRSGFGDGGAPQMIGSEYMLLTHFKNHKMTDNKDDLLGYVSVEIETK